MYTLSKCVSRVFAVGYAIKYIMRWDNKLKPDIFYANFDEIDASRIKEKGIKFIIIDKDNTITLPLENKIYNGEIAKKINEMKKLFGKKNIAVVSNSIYDKRQKDYKLISDNIGVEIIEHKKPKPFIKKEVLNYFKINEDDSKKIAIIGDRVLVDVLTARYNNFYSVLVNPIAAKKESIFIKIIRKFENKYKH